MSFPSPPALRKSACRFSNNTSPSIIVSIIVQNRQTKHTSWAFYSNLMNHPQYLIKEMFHNKAAPGIFQGKCYFLWFSLQKVYRSDLNYLRGAAWIATGALQIEGSKRATDLISDVRPLVFFVFFRIIPISYNAAYTNEGCCDIPVTY